MNPKDEIKQMFPDRQQQHQQADNGYMAKMIDSALASPLKTVTIDDDEEMKLLVAHELNGLTLAEFISKYGMSKTQAAALGKEGISSFCRQIEKNAVNDPCAFGKSWDPRTIPQKFTMVL